MKKEKLFYLDFIRAFATIVIVLTHYNALYLYLNPVRPKMAVLSTNVGNVYIGGFGVALFLIISGSALMYVYREKIEVKKFYLKRFFNLYPLFWLVYLLAFIFRFYQDAGFFPAIPKWRFIFSVLGIDQYLSNFDISNFGIISEWFLGFILIFYILFPLLRIAINKQPVLTAIGTAILYIVAVIFKWPNMSVALYGLLPFLVFGMLLIRYEWKVKWYVAWPMLLVIVGNGIFKPHFNDSVQSLYIGICGFGFLTYLARLIKWEWVHRLCTLICRYSYVIFLVHHYVIYQVTKKFNLNTITRMNSYLLFFTCFVVTCIVAYLIQKLYERIMKLLFGRVKVIS